MVILFYIFCFVAVIICGWCLHKFFYKKNIQNKEILPGSYVISERFGQGRVKCKEGSKILVTFRRAYGFYHTTDTIIVDERDVTLKT